MNPAKLGKLDNHTQEQWKLPLALNGRRRKPGGQPGSSRPRSRDETVPR